MCHFWNVKGFQAEEESANMFYTCGPNEAMVVSGKVLAVPLIVCSSVIATHAIGQSTQMHTRSNICWSSSKPIFGRTWSHFLQDYAVLLHWWLQEVECLSSRASSRFRGWHLNWYTKIVSISIMLRMAERVKLDAIFFFNWNVLVTAVCNYLHFMTLHLIFKEEIRSFVILHLFLNTKTVSLQVQIIKDRCFSRISLNTLTLNVKSDKVYTRHGVPISVTGIAQVSVIPSDIHTFFRSEA